MNIQILPLVSPPKISARIILIQGLDGTLYGPGMPISPFVSALTQRHPNRAISGLVYPSRLRDYIVGHGRSISDISSELTRHLTDLSEPAIVIGHCLGALICARTLMDLSGQFPAQAILLDALLDHPGPSTGAWEQGLLTRLDLPLPWLRDHGQAWRRFMSPAPGWLQVDAILSQSTSWVTPFCPTAGIAPGHQHQTGLTHQDLMTGPINRGQSVLPLIDQILTP